MVAQQYSGDVPGEESGASLDASRPAWDEWITHVHFAFGISGAARTGSEVTRRRGGGRVRRRGRAAAAGKVAGASAFRLPHGPGERAGGGGAVRSDQRESQAPHRAVPAAARSGAGAVGRLSRADQSEAEGSNGVRDDHAIERGAV